MAFLNELKKDASVFLCYVCTCACMYICPHVSQQQMNVFEINSSMTILRFLVLNDLPYRMPASFLLNGCVMYFNIGLSTTFQTRLMTVYKYERGDINESTFD